MAVKRINFLNVPIDILNEEDIEQTVMELLEKKTPQQVIFLTADDVLKARRKGEFREMVQNAALCLPISKSIIRGAGFLKKDVPIRRTEFNIIIDFLNVLDSHFKTLYLLGGRAENLAEAERNVKSTFPYIRVVGRFAGYYRKSMEPHIISAMVKAEPSIVIVGSGIQGGCKWIYRNMGKFNSGIFIRDANVIDIFAKQKKQISPELFEKGLEYLPDVVKNPFKIFKFFSWLWFNILLIFYKLSKKDTANKDNEPKT